MDDEPCPYPIGHVRQLGGQRWHRVYSPYGDGRWRDFDDDGRLQSFGGPWLATEVVRLEAAGARFAGRHAGERVLEDGSLEEVDVPLGGTVRDRERAGRRAARMTAATPAAPGLLERLGVRGAMIFDASGELVGAMTSSELAARLVDAHNARLAS